MYMPSTYVSILTQTFNKVNNIMVINVKLSPDQYDNFSVENIIVLPVVLSDKFGLSK